MRERILLMGAPGTGKSKQLINVIKYVAPRPVYCFDLEDKLDAMLTSEGRPSNMELYADFEWKEFRNDWDQVEKKIHEGDWVMVDRMDLSWPMVRRWYAREKFGKDLDEILLASAKNMTKKAMVIPSFDQGSWNVINSVYEELFLRIFYRSRCNILMTAGIKGIEDSAPQDIGRLGVLPRGQKELGHQPHSVFLLKQRQIGPGFHWEIQTDKDLPGREYFEKDVHLDNFAIEYLASVAGYVA